MGEPLTKYQKEVLDFIIQSIELYGYAPSYREIAKGLNKSSLATVASHVDTLVEKGYLEKGDNQARSLQVVEDEKADVIKSNSAKLEVLGMIAAGQAIETRDQQHRETLEVPPFMIGSKHSYVLQVKGESMVEDGIFDGDYIVVQEKQVPHNGEMVVALLNGSEATLKRYYKRNGYIELVPANSKMKPIIVKNGQQIDIQGVVIGVIRKY